MPIDTRMEEPRLPEVPDSYDPERWRIIISELLRQLRLIKDTIDDIAENVS